MGVLRFDSGVNKNAPAFVRWVYLLPMVFALVLASFGMLAALYGLEGNRLRWFSTYCPLCCYSNGKG